MTAWENGNYGQAGLLFGAMLGEQALTVVGFRVPPVMVAPVVTRMAPVTAEAGGMCIAKNVIPYGYDVNKLNHLFTNEHMLQPLLNKFGSQEAALAKMHEAAQYIAQSPYAYNKGSWVTLNIDGIAVTIKGTIINGEFRISTATMRPF